MKEPGSGPVGGCGWVWFFPWPPVTRLESSDCNLKVNCLRGVYVILEAFPLWFLKIIKQGSHQRVGFLLNWSRCLSHLTLPAWLKIDRSGREQPAGSQDSWVPMLAGPHPHQAESPGGPAAPAPHCCWIWSVRKQPVCSHLSWSRCSIKVSHTSSVGFEP